jgi:hypothetical protein
MTAQEFKRLSQNRAERKPDGIVAGIVWATALIGLPVIWLLMGTAV